MNSPNAATDRITQAQLDDIVRALVAAISPHRIILFGSHLYGRPTRDSDVDLMILHKDQTPNRYELSQMGYASLRDVDAPVELHFCREETFERFSSVVGSFQREVKQRGRVVYAA